jgi:hypothetical protein
VELLSSKPTGELVAYLDGLRSGHYAFNFGITGQQAASQLGFGKRFTAAYGQLVEEALLRMSRNGVVNIQDTLDYLTGIVAEEKRIDALTTQRETHFSSIVYLRALQVGECSFPYVFNDLPTAQALLGQVRLAYPELNLEEYSTFFADVFNRTVSSAQQRAAQAGSVSIFRNMEEWRHATLN